MYNVIIYNIIILPYNMIYNINISLYIFIFSYLYIYLYIYMFIHIYIIYIYIYLFIYLFKFNDETFKISLYFDFLQIFYGLPIKAKE